MKVKRLFSVLGLALFGFASVGAGVLASPKKAVEPVSATDDAMITVVIDLANAVGYDNFHYPEVHARDASYSTIDKYVPLHQLSGTYYTANITYDSSTQNIDMIGFLFKQSEDKWSNEIALNSLPNNVYHYSFTNTWSDGIWIIEKDTTWWGVPRVRGGGISDQNFASNVSNQTYKVTDLELSPGNTYQVFFGKWGFGAFRQSSVDNYLTSYSLNSFEVQYAGTYDIICYNDYSDGGIFEIKMHSETREYIYLVGYDITEDTALYTYGEGGIEEFNSFPGKKLKDIAAAEEIHGDLKFQGEEYNIWRVTVDMNYPKADHLILSQINEFGVVGSQTANMTLVRHSAYWFSDEDGYHNDLAGASLDFLFGAEAVRKAAADGSVCSITKEQATAIVNDYNSQGNFMHETYIDCTKVNTWADKTKLAKKDFTYRQVIEELAEIAEIPISGGLRYSDPLFASNNISIIVIISVVSLASVTAIGLLLIKRRKHQ